MLGLGIVVCVLVAFVLPVEIIKIWHAFVLLTVFKAVIVLLALIVEIIMVKIASDLFKEIFGISITGLCRFVFTRSFFFRIISLFI